METEQIKDTLASALSFSRRIVDLLSDNKAEDIVLMDIHEIASFADYFVICNGTSERQIQALTAALKDEFEDEGTKQIQIEGKGDSGWVLIDFGDVIVHVFSPEHRDFYKLERVWANAQVILRVQ